MAGLTFEQLQAMGAQPSDGSTPQGQGLTFEQLQEMGAVPHEEQSTGSKVLSAALLPLHYGGDVVRAGLGELTGTLKEGEGVAALKGQGAPSSDELLKRAGWENTTALSDVMPSLYSDTGNEWLKFKKGGIVDPTARGAVGLAADVATDPLTYLTAGLSKMAGKEGAGKAIKAFNAYLNPVGTATEYAGKGVSKAGEKLFKSGFKNVDAVAKEAGKEVLPSDVFLKNKMWGSAQSIFAQAREKIDDIMSKVDDIAQKSGAQGVQANMDEAMRPVREHIADLRSRKVLGNDEIADALEAQANRYVKEMGGTAAKEIPSGTKAIIRGARKTTEELPVNMEDGLIKKVVGNNPTLQVVDVPTQYPEGAVGAIEKQMRIFPGEDITQTQFVSPESKLREGLKLFEKKVPDFKVVPGTRASNLSEVLEAKSRQYSALPKDVWDRLSKDSAFQKGVKSIARGLKEESERMADLVEPGKLKGLNEEAGALLTGQKTMRKEAMSELKKNAITQVDALAAAAGLKYVLGKQAAKTAFGTSARTGAGLLMNRAGNATVDAMGRPVLRSAWGSIGKNALGKEEK